MKASALGIYTVLSTAAGYISSTPLGYVNCFDKQYSAKYYILQATNWLTHGYIRTALGLRPRNRPGYIPRNHGLTYTYLLQSSMVIYL